MRNWHAYLGTSWPQRSASYRWINDLFYRCFCDIFGIVLALHDPVLHDDRGGGFAVIELSLHVLGRRSSRLPFNAGLYRHGLSHIPRKGRDFVRVRLTKVLSLRPGTTGQRCSSIYKNEKDFFTDGTANVRHTTYVFSRILS